MVIHHLFKFQNCTGLHKPARLCFSPNEGVLQWFYQTKEKGRFSPEMEKEREEKIAYLLLGVVAGCICFMLSNWVYLSFYYTKSIEKSIEAAAPASIMEEQDKYPEINTLRERFPELDIIRNWEESSLLQRITLLWTVSKIEEYYLGLGSENSTSVRLGTLEQGEYSRYNEEEAEIILDSAMVKAKNPEKPLREMLFHLYHHYQVEVIKAYNQIDGELQALSYFDDVRVLEEEFDSETLDEAIDNRESFAFFRATYYMQLYDEHKEKNV